LQSQLGWVGLRWALRYYDGSLALFQDCGPGYGKCALIETRDADRHRVRYVRDRSSLLLKIEAPSQRITFEYDAKRRIVAASDSLNGSVQYAYDSNGRLSKVVASDGAVRSYTYSDRDEMLTIDEPGWRIANTFDDAGRVVRQITQMADSTDPYTIDFRYTVVDGAVVQTDVVEDGIRTRYTFNQHRYVLSESIDVDGDNPIVVTYERNPRTNLVTKLTLRCLGPDGPVDWTETDVGWAEETKRELIEAKCL
jgi:YD repeat-containing protein